MRAVHVSAWSHACDSWEKSSCWCSEPSTCSLFTLTLHSLCPGSRLHMYGQLVPKLPLSHQRKIHKPYLQLIINRWHKSYTTYTVCRHHHPFGTRLAFLYAHDQLVMVVQLLSAVLEKSNSELNSHILVNKHNNVVFSKLKSKTVEPIQWGK